MKLVVQNYIFAGLHGIAFLGVLIWYAVLNAGSKELSKLPITRQTVKGPGATMPPQLNYYFSQYKNGSGILLQTPNLSNLDNALTTLYTTPSFNGFFPRPGAFCRSKKNPTEYYFAAMAGPQGQYGDTIYKIGPAGITYIAGVSSKNPDGSINGLYAKYINISVQNFNEVQFGRIPSLVSYMDGTNECLAVCDWRENLVINEYSTFRILKFSTGKCSVPINPSAVPLPHIRSICTNDGVYFYILIGENSAGDGITFNNEMFNQIYQYDSITQFIHVIAGINLRSDGNFSDGKNPQKISAPGKYPYKWWGPGALPGAAYFSATEGNGPNASTGFFIHPLSMTIDDNYNLYVYESDAVYGSRIRKLTYKFPGNQPTDTLTTNNTINGLIYLWDLSTIAGPGVEVNSPLYRDGVGSNARFNSLDATGSSWGNVLTCTADGSVLYLADVGNRMIRRIYTASGLVQRIVGVQFYPPLTDNSVTPRDSLNGALAILATPIGLSLSANEATLDVLDSSLILNDNQPEYEAIRSIQLTALNMEGTEYVNVISQNFTTTPSNYSLFKSFLSLQTPLPADQLMGGSWNFSLSFSVNSGGTASMYPKLYKTKADGSGKILLASGERKPQSIATSPWLNKVLYSLDVHGQMIDENERFLIELWTSLGPNTELIMYTSPTTSAYVETTIGYESASSSAPSKCSTKINYDTPKELFHLNSIILALFFFFVTILAHLFYATDAFKTGLYSRELAKGWNPFRWAEYAISASTMTVILAGAAGIRDVASLSTLALATASIQGCGYLTELLLKMNVIDIGGITVATATGWALFFALWFSIIWSFSTLVHDVNTLYKDMEDAQGEKIHVPNWVTFIILVEAIQFALFGVVQLRHIAKRLKGMPIEDYARVIEPMYTTLSASAKLSLAGGAAYGLLFRSNGCGGTSN